MKSIFVKAQANGRPTLLTLAMEESKTKTQAGFDDELRGAGLLSPEDLKKAEEELEKQA